MPPGKKPLKRIDFGGNPNQNRKIVQANIQDRAQVEATRAEDGSIVSPKFYKNDRMMGTSGDTGSKLKGFDYGKNGVWKNRNRTQVATSSGEDAPLIPSKSTGDFGNAIHIHLHGNDSGFNVQKAAKLRNKKYKGKAGY
jgi:hypothetical protein